MSTEQRLIDANALLKTGSGIKIVIRNDCHPYEAIRIQGNAFRKAVEQAPTIEARPVVHGRWEHNEYGFQCSVCMGDALYNGFNHPVKSDFCPNCGADMKSKGD